MNWRAQRLDWPNALRLLSHLRVTGLLDQGLLAISRFAAVSVLARSLSKDDFGIMALVVTTTYFVVAVQRALVALPFINQCAGRHALETHGATWLLLSVSLAAVCGVIFAITAAGLYLVGAPTWTADMSAILAVAAPSIWIYEFLRRWLYQRMSYSAALLQAVMFCICTAVTLVLVSTRFNSLKGAVLTVTVPYVVAALISLYQHGPSTRAHYRTAIHAIKDSWDFTRWTLADSVVVFIQGVGPQFWLAAMTGPSGSAVFGATRNLVAPVMTLISSIELSEMPHLSRVAAERKQSLGGSAARVGAFILILTVPFLSVLALFSDQILRLAYSTNYSGYSTELHLWIAIGFVYACSSPLEMWLLVSSYSSQLLQCRLVGTFVTLLVGVALIGRLGVAGGLTAVLCGDLTGVLMEAFFIFRLRRRRTRGRSPDDQVPL